jgi:hypothetical protein
LNIRNGVENAVVGAVHDDRVLQLPGLLEVVDDPAHLGVRVLREAGVHLGHAREEALLVVGEARPRADGVALHDLALGQRVDRGQLRVLREDALLDHARQDPLAVGLVAVVEPALVLVDVLLRGVVRGVVRAGAEPEEPRLGGVRLLRVADEAHRLVGEVLGEVVALLRHVGLVDVVVVLDEVGIPVVRLAPDEAVEAVEATGERPIALRRPHGPLVDRHVVVLADPERVPALLAEHLGHRRVLHRDVARVAGEALGALGDLGEAVLVVVAAGEEARPRRGAQRGRVPLRVRQPVVGEPLHRRHLDAPAVGRPCRQTRVVVEDDEDVGRALGSLLGQIRPPVRDGVAESRLITPLNCLAMPTPLARVPAPSQTSPGCAGLADCG